MATSGSAQRRAFAQKMNKSQASDVRRQIQSARSDGGAVPKSLSGSLTNGPLSLNPISSVYQNLVEPLEYEEFIRAHQSTIDRDTLRHLLQFPIDDIEVKTIQKKPRTVGHILPDNVQEISCRERDCLQQYTANYTVAFRRYGKYSPCEVLADMVQKRNERIDLIPRQIYECDQLYALEKAPSARIDDNNRASWANGAFNLNQANADPFIPGLFDKTSPEDRDAINRRKRLEKRQPAIFSLYPAQDEEDQTERRLIPDLPRELSGHKLYVKVLALKLDLDVEPVFGSMALFDIREKKRVSENFYFDFNSDQLKRMIAPHVGQEDLSTLAQGCVFNVMYPSADLALVIRLEKVLQQGEVSDIADMYVKDEKSRVKVAANAQVFCERLGKYRMPLGWTAIYLSNIVNGTSTNSGTEDDVGSIGTFSSTVSNRSDKGSSLERSLNPLELLRRGKQMVASSAAGDLLTSLPRGATRSNSIYGEETLTNLDSFRSVTVSLPMFFKYDGDKVSEDDMYKLVADLKRPTITRKLKGIPGSLKLDISPCPDGVPPGTLTSELVPLQPASDGTDVRPTKEVLEFPTRDIYSPNQLYRNLLYVYPKSLNFSNRPGSARNIAIKVQLLGAEDCPLKVIFGKSSCPELQTECYADVLYHNKTPVFADEIKMKLPVNLEDKEHGYHLFFTFLHISCQTKDGSDSVETPVGYTWLPLISKVGPDGMLICGEYNLPVMLEKPSSSYSRLHPETQIPGSKWVDNHKNLFTVVIQPVSTIHTSDIRLERFFNYCSYVDSGRVPNYVGEGNIENSLRDAIAELATTSHEPLIRFLNVLLEKLLLLIVRPPLVHSQPINVSGASFDGVVSIVHVVSTSLASFNDIHGRNSLLLSYIYYHCLVKRFPLSEHDVARESFTSSRSLSEVNALSYAAHTFERTGSVRGTADTSPTHVAHRNPPHEMIALQWALCSGPSREYSLRHSWFFFELLIQCMTQYLTGSQRLHYPRANRFSERFIDDLQTLVKNFIDDIVGSGSKELSSLNTSLAFFFFDCLSLLDRGMVLKWIHLYCKKVNTKLITMLDPTHLLSMKLDMLRIVASHEHFFPLNLPFPMSSTWTKSLPASPSPSVSSSNSLNSSASSGGPLPSSFDASSSFRQQHYLIGLILHELNTALFLIPNPALHVKGVNIVRNLASWHDADPRYSMKEARQRLAHLYLPLVGIIMDSLTQLFDFSSVDSRTKTISKYAHNHHVGVGINGSLSSTSDAPNRDSGDFDYVRKPQLNAEATRHLLACFIWIIKSADEQTLRSWWESLSPTRLSQLLEIFQMCCLCFEYTGPKSVHTRGHTGIQREELKSMLGDAILGSIHARNESRKKGVTGSYASLSSSDGLRFRKDQLFRPFPLTDSAHAELEPESLLESVLCAEINLTVLDCLEQVVQVISTNGALHDLLGSAFRVLMTAMGCSQSTQVYENLFATQRTIIQKFPELVFESETEYCADLCNRLLTHCSSGLPSVRSQASASLYLLMRQNYEIGNSFSRVKMQVTISLSSLVGTITDLNEDFLRRSLKTVLSYAENDYELKDTSFPEQVKDLVFNLHMILSDTVKMKAYQEDPEMLMDLMYRIAKGYRNSPDLRLTWLANMAQKLSERDLFAETAQCLIHSAALVSEYLHLIEDRPYLPVGCAAFSKLSTNILEESAVSDDTMSPNEEGVCTSKSFSENGLIQLLEQAAASFERAGMYESVNEVYKLWIPIAETYFDYRQLAQIHKKLHECFSKIDKLSGKRVFGSFFRVGFYGHKFGDIDGEEFVYKEPPITKLPEISHRLEAFYAAKFGPQYVELVKDSNAVKREILDPEKCYIQITYVEPFFDLWEVRARPTVFLRNYNINRFVYSTPFTLDGRSHGDLHEQYKRKTILTTQNTFPYVKTRIKVVKREQIVLTPIELAIEDIQKKTEELTAAIRQDPPDAKMLQMVLQGSIGTTVNQGPLEVAAVFLSHPHDQPMTAFQHKLRLCFKEFSRRCSEALKKNENLIAPDQKEYQRELRKNYQRFHDSIKPMLIYNEEMHAAEELENTLNSHTLSENP